MPTIEPQDTSSSESRTPGEATNAARSAAAERCAAEWNRVFREERAKREPEILARRAAAFAYRGAMPSLVDPESIRDFIACTAHGVLIGAIDAKDSSKLLYAAQVALAAQPRSSLPRKRTAAE